ncbi:MAG: hypothetical protein R3F11_07320 [Verrucomicrobiales bacterium]
MTTTRLLALDNSSIFAGRRVGGEAEYRWRCRGGRRRRRGGFFA